MEVCRYLLGHGADTDIVDEEGKIAYDYAVERGETAMPVFVSEFDDNI